MSKKQASHNKNKAKADFSWNAAIRQMGEKRSRREEERRLAEADFSQFSV